MLSQPLLLVSLEKPINMNNCDIFLTLEMLFILVKVKEAAVEIPTPNTSGGVYIPPTRRLQSAGGSSSSSSAASKSRAGSRKSCV